MSVPIYVSVSLYIHLVTWARPASLSNPTFQDIMPLRIYSMLLHAVGQVKALKVVGCADLKKQM